MRCLDKEEENVRERENGRMMMVSRTEKLQKNERKEKENCYLEYDKIKKNKEKI